MFKQAVRQTMIARRKGVSEVVQHQASVAVADYFCQTLLFFQSYKLGIYHVLGRELDPSTIVQTAWQCGKSCYLPVCSSEAEMRFVKYKPTTRLAIGDKGFLEPCSWWLRRCLACDLDVVLLPLVAFDHQGHRLGRGKGYYDKTFSFMCQAGARHRPRLVGLAYAWQCVDQLLPDRWDVALDCVVTDQGIIYLD